MDSLPDVETIFRVLCPARGKERARGSCAVVKIIKVPGLIKLLAVSVLVRGFDRGGTGDRYF